MAQGSASRSGNLTVELASGESFDIREFTVNERLSSLFEISLLALSDNPSIDFEAVVGQPARFTMHGADGAPRVWTGICNELSQVGVEEAGLSTYHIGIVPTLWLATQRRNHRMFQHLSEPDIALELLQEWGIEPTLKIDKGAYKTRKYRVQYGESDFAFISRMLEDAGITFYFEPHEGETKMVLSDVPHHNEPRAPIAFRDNPTVADREHVTSVRVGRKVRPGKYTMRDVDHRRPSSYKLMSSASHAPIPLEEKLKRFHYTPGAFLYGTDKGGDTPVADDKHKARTDETEAQKLAQKRLEAKRGGATSIVFSTNVPDLAPGTVVSFLDHPRADLAADKRLLVLESHRSGTVNGEWHFQCEARSASTPFRPSLSTPRPKVNGVESATVVGPPGEEIHCDEFGRVRVHFHWDRESKMDDNSSCWIPVSQPWGGSGFGGSNLPRVGQEVIIDFLGGDPDRPVIVGRVYTNLNKTPYKLPDNKAQSGWKSNSTGGTGGYNELMMEDTGGKELFRMQAERDYKKLVKHDEHVTIGNDRTKIVQGNKNVTIGADRTKQIAGNENVTIGADRSKLVKASETVNIGKNMLKQVVGSEREVTGMNRSVVVGVNRSTQVGGIDSTMVGSTHAVSIAPPGEGGPGGTGYSMSEDNFTLGTTSGARISFEGDTIKLSATTVTIDAKSIYVIAQSDLGVASMGQATVGGASQLTLGSSGGDVLIKGGPMVKINT